MENLQIRPMTMADVPAVYAIETSCFSDPWSEDSFAFALENNPIAHFLVVEDGGILCGYISYYHVVDEGQIINIAVSPDYRRKGIGRALMEAFLQKAYVLGIKTLTLEVRASNQAAKALYEAFGFVQNGLRKKYYSDPREDAILMICSFDETVVWEGKSL